MDGAQPRRVRAGGALPVIWLPPEFVIGWLTVLAAMTPFDAGPGAGVFPQGWAAIPLVLLLGVLLAGWTAGGAVVAREVEIREVETLAGGVALSGRRRTDIPTGPGEQRDEIAAVLRGYLEPAGDRPRPPLLIGWTAYVDDLGPTIVRRRRGRRRTVRWTARPGAVVRVDRPCADPAFEAQSLEWAEHGTDEEHRWHSLDAVATADGRHARPHPVKSLVRSPVRGLSPVQA